MTSTELILREQMTMQEYLDPILIIVNANVGLLRASAQVLLRQQQCLKQVCKLWQPLL